MNGGSGIIYKLVDGEWQIVFDGPASSYRTFRDAPNRSDTICEVCGVSTWERYSEDYLKFYGTQAGTGRNTGGMAWRCSPTNRSRIVEPLERVWACRKHR